MPHEIQALLLEHVPSTGVGQRDRGPPAVRTTPHEDQRANPFGANEHLAHVRAHAREQGDRKAGAAHQGMSQRQGVEATLAGGFCHHGVPHQGLHQLCMDLDAHGIVPTGDIRDGPGQRLALLSVARRELAFDLAEVPPGPVDATIDVGTGQAPRLANLPDEEESQQIPVLDQCIDRFGHHGAALVQLDLRPRLVFLECVGDRGHGLFVIDEGRPGNGRAVHAVHVVTRNTDPPPFPPGQISQAVGIEGFGRHLYTPGIRLPPRCARFENE